MSLKKFGIVSGIFIAVVIVITIVLSCVKTTTMLNIDDPSSIVVYNYNTVGTTYSKENTKAKYDKILKEVKNIGKLSILDRAVNKVDVNDTISQDINKKYPQWTGDANLKNGICVELKFEKTQSQIVYVDGDSKRIDFKQIIFVVPEDGKTQEIAIYFMISSGATYSASPMIINANCKSLLKTIKSV